MNKILLVTLWDNRNFGNRIQAIALKHMIEQVGYSVICANSLLDGVKKTLRRIAKGCLGILHISKNRKEYLYWIRFFALVKSSRKYLKPQTRLILNYHSGSKVIAHNYIGVVVGSDQVWHRWTRYENELSYYYLMDIPREKRVAYAASFGFEAFPLEDIEQHKTGIEGIRFLSCREKSGCQLVKKLTGRQVDLVLDPTLCVDVNYWSQLEEKPVYVTANSRYLLIFIIGKQQDFRKAIEDFAKVNNFTIIDLYDLTQKDVWRTTIGGFLWLVHNAEMICTDSFHCTVFSILYEKPFQVFQRSGKGFEQMYNRIETLLSLTGLESCQYNGKCIHQVSADYEYAKKKIGIEKEKSTNWLKNSLAVLNNAD